MPQRTGKQIRDRFLNALDNKLKKEKLSFEENKKIIKWYKIFGNSWSKIAKKLKGRTGDMVKNRFYSSLKNHLDDYDDIIDEKGKRKKRKYKKRNKTNKDITTGKRIKRKYIKKTKEDTNIQNSLENIKSNSENSTATNQKSKLLRKKNSQNKQLNLICYYHQRLSAMLALLAIYFRFLLTCLLIQR